MSKRCNNHKLSKVGEPGSTVCFVCLKWVMDHSSIGGSVQSLQDTLQGFAAQSEEFSASSEEVAAATEEQTAAMHQMTSAAQDLTKQGEELAQLVSQFEVPE